MCVSQCTVVTCLRCGGKYNKGLAATSVESNSERISKINQHLSKLCLKTRVAYLPPTKEEVYVFFAHVRLSVCWQDYSKMGAQISMKCCVSTGVGTWTNWLTFEPDPDYSLDAGTGLLSPISYALQRRIFLRRENPTYSYWAPVATARCGFKMVLFTASRGNTFVRGKCALPSALLVCRTPQIHVTVCKLVHLSL